MPRPLSAPKIAEFREKLCDSAVAVFAAHGREGLTMRAVALALGVSPMTPYRYFHDKDEILAAVRARAFDRFADAIEPAFALPGTALARARAVADAYVRFAFGDRPSYRLMFDLTQPDEEHYPDLIRATARARRTMTAYVKALVDEGELEGDPAVIGHVFWASLHGAVVLELAGKLTPTCDFERIRGETFRALLRGYRPAGR